MDKFIEWLHRQRNEDNVLTELLKLGYLLGQKAWLHSIIAFVLGVFIPIFYGKNKMSFFLVAIVLMILDIIYANVCSSYQKKMYVKRKLSAEILSEQSSLIKSIVIEMENNKSWKNNIFKTVSNLVCEKIYRNFKDVHGCETRISVEYVFDKNTGTASRGEKHVKMSGRKSNHRSTVKKSVPLSRRHKYYSYRIFSRNNRGINILTDEEIHTAGVWYRNPNNSTDVKKYIGIAVSLYDEAEVKFILQIDCLDEIKFGETDSDSDVKEFVETYLMSYINLVSVAYLLNLNSKKEIPEV